MKTLLKKAKKLSFKFWNTSFEIRKKIILDLANSLEENSENILRENKKDLENMSKEDPLFDRLLLTKERITWIANSCREIAKQEDVLWKILEEKEIEWGIKLKKVSTAIWVIACIYEARPNVTVDIATLCIFTGNIAILKGSSSAKNSNKILIKIIQEILEKNWIEKEVVSKYSINRDDLKILFNATEEVDLLIPRGWKNLINRVRKESLVPTIETWAWVCHTFVDEEFDEEKAVNIVVNAKTQRPSVCNALDTLIVHKNLPQSFFDKLSKNIEKHWVEIFADKNSFEKMKNYSKLKKANNETWWKEFLWFWMSIKTVSSTEEAINHINKFGSRHSEAIITKNIKNSEDFLNLVDASSVYLNSSTRFTDWWCFWLWAEIWISTQKLHSRWPMWAESLTTYKYKLYWDGQIRKQ